MNNTIPREVRNALRSVVRDGHGLTNDQVIETFAKSFPKLDKASSEYFHRVALIRILGEISDGRQLESVPDPDQGDLFYGFSYPSIISVVSLKDGKPDRIRKEFLDATLEEADSWCAPTVRKNRGNTAKEKASQFINIVRPFVPTGGTLRQGMEAARKRPH